MASMSSAVAALLRELAPGGGISEAQWARLRHACDRDGVLDHALECVDRRLVAMCISPAGRTAFVVTSTRPGSSSGGARGAGAAAAATATPASRYVVMAGYCSCAVVREWAGATASAASASSSESGVAALRAALCAADDHDAAFDALCKHAVAVAIARALSPALPSLHADGGGGGGGGGTSGGAEAVGGGVHAGLGGGGALLRWDGARDRSDGDGDGDGEGEGAFASQRSGRVSALGGSEVGAAPSMWAPGRGHGLDHGKLRITHVSDAEMAALLMLPLGAPPSGAAAATTA